MKKIIIYILSVTLITILPGNSLVGENPKEKLEKLLKSELQSSNEHLFYKITTFWNEVGYEYYGNNDYRVIFDKKHKYFTFINNNITLTELTNSYKKSKPLIELKKQYARFVEEDKDEIIYFSNSENIADNTISFVFVLRDILKRGENLRIKNNEVTGNFSNDILLPGFDRLIFSDSENVFKFKVSFKNDIIQSYEFYMYSGEGEYRKKRMVSVERSKISRKYNWPKESQIIKRSDLESKIVELSLPVNKIKLIKNYSNIDELRAELNIERTLFSSVIVKLKDGYGIYSDIRDRKNYLDAICFESLEDIKNFRECRAEDQPDYNSSLKVYIDILDKLIEKEYPLNELYQALDMISHSLFLYDRTAIVSPDDSDHYSWYYTNNISRYIHLKNI